ncbi:MAG TPA: helix-turn-helix domain-containing protein [Pirellulaceae bacterium]|nr:helix-turn-helix domain-containing protein [Pirellulaceae bacterium]
MGRKSSVSVEQRREAVLSLLRKEEAAAVLSRRYGVSEQTLYRWRDDFLAAGEAALAGSNGKDATAQKRRVAELEKEIEKRDQVIGEYTIANRFLKKLSEGSN